MAAPEEAAADEDGGAEVIDLMQVLKQSLAEEEGAPAGKTTATEARRAEKSGAGAESRRAPRAAPATDLEQRPKSELYERARALGITGRSGMSKAELIDAIRARR